MTDVNRYAAVTRVGHPGPIPTDGPVTLGAVTLTDRDEAVIRAALGVYREFVERQIAEADEVTQLGDLWRPVLPQIDAVTAKLDGE